MPRSALIAALCVGGLLSACHDAATLVSGPEARSDAPGAAASPPEPAPRPITATIVRVIGDEIRVGDAVVARARPSSAPGVLDDELRASYVLEALREALAEALAEAGDRQADVFVVLRPDAPLSHLRAVLLSAGHPIRVILDPDPARVALTEASVGLRLHPAPPSADGDAGPVLDLPDDRPMSEVLRVAASASPGDAGPSTFVLATDAAPCVEPPTGMRCVAGGPSDDGGDDPLATRATFYIDLHEATIEQYDACRDGGGCRARRSARRREPLEPPVLRVDEARARAWCAWMGKRLPSDAELAKAGLESSSSFPERELRCATEHPFLTRFPPLILDAPRPALELPEPPTPQQLAIFARVVDDPVQDKKICGAKVRASWHASQLDGGRSEPTCRDPFSYLTTNEPRGHIWLPYIRDIGGAYVGIGSDQSYSFIAAARSRWAWVMDYDPRVVQNHLRLRAFVLASPTAEQFVALFAPKNKHRALAILDEAYGDDPRLATLRWGFVATREELEPYFVAQHQPSRRQRGFGWLRDPASYRYIRTLFEQGRISVKAGDLLKDGAMQQMGAAALELGVPVRIYYTSNAPTAWGGQVTPEYRRNVLALPFDADSLVLQTTDGGGSLRQKTKWHHNVQWGRLLHERLQEPHNDNVWKLLEGRIPGDDQALTVLGLPSR